MNPANPGVIGCKFASERQRNELSVIVIDFNCTQIVWRRFEGKDHPRPFPRLQDSLPSKAG
jgi:hypothetical protein